MKLGSFEVGERIGKGGMGTVWKGEHVGEETAVAIKIVRPEVMEESRNLEAFDNEVRAVASLNHPNIVTVLDFGRVPDEVAEAAGEVVEQGAPYLVMEYGRGGSVADYFGELRWPDVRELLLVTLDGLAHAHARDVIHRDLKPENILVGCGEDWEVKLTDFGLAHATDQFRDSGQVESAWGTPVYMAPEQLRGLWREYGPWTDLYALGCMAFELVVGRVPYDGEAMVQIAHGHIEDPVPPVDPRFATPPGLEEWIHAMMAKSRADRFEHAADAAHALAQLPALEDQQEFGVLFEPPRPDARTLEGDRIEPATLVFPDVEPTRPMPDSEEGSEPVRAAGESSERDGGEVPPLPVDWRRDRQSTISDELMGISLGLFGLRAIPLVNREPERDRMWEMLEEVHSDSRARQLVVEGTAGTGKSELAKWLCRRAREVGGARVFRAYHSPVAGPADGLVAMVERFLRCVKLEGQARRDHIADLLVDEGLAGEVELRTLLSLIEGRAGPDGGGPTGRDERFAIIYDLVAKLASRRPVVVWLDDVQWGWDALGFAHYLQRRQNSRPAPILVVMTVRTEAIESRRTERRMVRALEASEGVETMEVPPLADRHTERLVRQLLRLDDQLADHVLDRSEGVPLFAVQLVEDWVSRGKLRMGEEGFELREGADVSVPDDIYRLWDDRIEGVGQSGGEDVFEGLEMAAALGQEIETVEWSEALQIADLSPPDELVDRLVERDLADRHEEGWRFGHGMLRESLERRAREAGRWARWNAYCARAVEGLHDRDEPEVPERLAMYWLEAGRRDEGLRNLSRAVDQAVERSDYQHALDLIDWRDSVAPRGAVEWELTGQLDRARVAARRGNYERCVEMAESVVERAEGAERSDMAARGRLWAGVGRRFRGALDEAERAVREAQKHFEETDRSMLAEAVLQRGRIEEHHGDYERARQHFERARSLFEQLGDTLGEARSLNALGDVRRRSGNAEEARRASLEALDRFEELDNIAGIADCLDDLAGLARRRGEYDRAADYAGEAHRLYSAIGSEQRHVVRLNRALIRLESGEYAGVGDEFEELIEIFEDRDRQARGAEARAGLLVARASRGRWDGWRRRLETIEKILAETDVHAHDVPPALEVAGRLADRAGRSEMASEVRRVARLESSEAQPVRRETESES